MRKITEAERKFNATIRKGSKRQTFITTRDGLRDGETGKFLSGDMNAEIRARLGRFRDEPAAGEREGTN